MQGHAGSIWKFLPDGGDGVLYHIATGGQTKVGNFSGFVKPAKTLLIGPVEAP
jgi:hypothetical protein